jgi:hypothetical protein
MRDDGVGTNTVVAVSLVWLIVAAALGGAGVFEPLRPPAPQAILIGLTALTLLATALIAPLRRWARTVDVRVLVVLHLTRILAGAWFLVLYRRGELPYAFAVPGGIGDIVVGALALLLLAEIAPSTAQGRRLYALWNVLGLIDILFVVATATRIAVGDPGALAPLLRLPLSVLPTWLVPLIIATHVVLAARLARPREPYGALAA